MAYTKASKHALATATPPALGTLQTTAVNFASVNVLVPSQPPDPNDLSVPAPSYTVVTTNLPCQIVPQTKPLWHPALYDHEMVKIHRAYVLTCDISYQQYIIEGNRLVWGNRTFLVADAPQLWIRNQSSDHVEAILEELQYA